MQLCGEQAVQCRLCCSVLSLQVAPAVRDIGHQAVGWQGHGAGHDAAVGADDVAQLAADLLAEVVTDLRSAAVGHRTVVTGTRLPAHTAEQGLPCTPAVQRRSHVATTGRLSAQCSALGNRCLGLVSRHQCLCIDTLPACTASVPKHQPQPGLKRTWRM